MGAVIASTCVPRAKERLATGWDSRADVAFSIDAPAVSAPGSSSGIANSVSTPTLPANTLSRAKQNGGQQPTLVWIRNRNRERSWNVKVEIV